MAGKERPLFLKVVYHGPAAMEQLAGYDSRLIVGILGGASGTTFDAFHQLWEAKKYGARAALYGRMINNAEHQLTFIEHLRGLADGRLEPPEAVRSYHAALQRLGIAPIAASKTICSHAAAAPRRPRLGSRRASNRAPAQTAAEQPDFSKMTPAEKLAWNRARWNRILG